MTGSLSPAARLLLFLCRKPGSADYPMQGVHYEEGKELDQLEEAFPNITGEVAGKVVADWGCSYGHQTVALAGRAKRVYGIDINDSFLAAGKRLAESRGVADRVIFAPRVPEGVKCDAIITRNSFEHFMHPEETLADMAAALEAGGRIYITFAPPWYAPWGAHMAFFCKVPWVHLVFSEKAVMEARSMFRSDEAGTYSEAGLARMSVSKFERVVERSGLRIVWKRYDCIKGMNWLASTPLREPTVNRVNSILE